LLNYWIKTLKTLMAPITNSKEGGIANYIYTYIYLYSEFK